MLTHGGIKQDTWPDISQNNYRNHLCLSDRLTDTYLPCNEIKILMNITIWISAGPVYNVDSIANIGITNFEY